MGNEQSHESQPQKPSTLPPVFFPTAEHAPSTNDQGSDFIDALKAELTSLSPMDKQTMSGRCQDQTQLMEDFMKDHITMKNITGKWFVQGVRAFELTTPISERNPEEEIVLKDEVHGTKYRMTIGEILEWQKSYRVFVANDIYCDDETGRDQIKEALSGLTADGEEAWRVKFCIRVSINPIYMYFDGIVFDRKVGDPVASNIYLVSVCGMDFAGRQHDVEDIKKYITNWNEVYHLIDGNLIAPFGGRDFFPTGVPAVLDKEKLLKDLKKMARLRLRAQDKLGIKVCGEVGIGLGVFSGDKIGIGVENRLLSVRALKEVLEEETFENIEVVVCAMPAFKALDNYHYFVEGFKTYKGKTKVWIFDQDMHKIARTAAKYCKTSELNPADSHGVFGEYWQNRGPGTEEKLALTTAGLLTQHHAVNPHVLNPENYIFLDLESPPSASTSEQGEKEKEV